jgi:hypothetical protein
LLIGGTGRAIIGHLSLPAGVADENYGLNWMVMLGSSSRAGQPVPPLDVMEKSAAERQRWEQEYWKSEEGKLARAKMEEQNRKLLRPIVAADRTFQIPEVGAGTYEFTAIFSKVVPDERGSNTLKRVATTTRQVVVPEMAGGVSDEPLNLGEIRLTAVREKLEAGADMSELSFSTLDGKTLKISDLKGRYLVLNIWMPYSKEYLPDRAQLGALIEEYGKSGRFAMVGICTYADPEAMKVYLDARPMSWPQVVLGTSSGQELFMPDMKRVLWLIGPDGKLVARDLDMAGLIRIPLDFRAPFGACSVAPWVRSGHA